MTKNIVIEWITEVVIPPLPNYDSIAMQIGKEIDDNIIIGNAYSLLKLYQMVSYAKSVLKLPIVLDADYFDLCDALKDCAAELIKDGHANFALNDLETYTCNLKEYNSGKFNGAKHFFTNAGEMYWAMVEKVKKEGSLIRVYDRLN